MLSLFPGSEDSAEGAVDLTDNLAPRAVLTAPDARLLVKLQDRTLFYVITPFTPTPAAKDMYPCRSGAERLPAYLGEDRPCALLRRKVEPANLSGIRLTSASQRGEATSLPQMGGVEWCDSGCNFEI